jgi:hypothetical protein
VAFLLPLFYCALYFSCVVTDARGTAYYPLWLSGRLALAVQKAGTRQAAINRYGIDAIQQYIAESPRYAMVVTTLTLLVAYTAVFTCPSG